MSGPVPGSETVNLLRTKLFRPRISGDLVPRLRLIERLAQGLERKLTLVSAGAGFGKTTLLVQWLEDSDRPVAWLSLDYEDSDPVVFLSYLVAALQTLFPEACPSARSLLKAPELPPADYLTTTLANEIAELPEPIVLVLDDYHRIQSEAVHQILVALISKLPPQMHLVVASRLDPPLPLISLRAGQQLTEIRVDALRFSFEEAQAYLEQTVGADLSTDTVAALRDRTEGWIVGLRLAALSMRGLDDHQAFVRSFYGSHRDIVDYLVTEVLSRQPSAVQAFLLQTSVLDRFCAPLCDAVLDTGDWRLETDAPATANAHSTSSSQAMLDYLDRANVFLVALDHERRWWRYHHLFQELLRIRLRMELTEDEIAALHRRAGNWFAQHGTIDEALRHLMAAGDAVGAARLVEDHREALMEREDWPTLERWLGMLPHEILTQRPSLSIAQAWPMLYRYQLASILPTLEKAEKCLEEGCEPVSEAERRALNAEMDTLRSFVYFVSFGDAERSIFHAKRALAHLPIAQTNARGLAQDMMCVSLFEMGQAETAIALLDETLADPSPSGPSKLETFIALCFVHLSAADLRRLWQTAEAFLKQAVDQQNPSAVSWGHCFAGLAHYEWNELEPAVEHFQRAMEQRYRSVYLANHLSMLCLAKAYQAQRKPIGASETLDALRSFNLEMNASGYLGDIDALRAGLSLIQGDLASAGQWAASENPSDQLEPMTASEVQGLTWAEVLLAQGTADNLDQAMRYLHARLAQSEARNNTRRTIQNLAHLGLALEKQGKTDDALNALKRAVTLAQPGGFVRTFVDLGPGMAKLLLQLAELDVAPAYIGRLLAAFDSLEPTAHIPPLIEPLTPREMEVLGLLAERLTDREIAQKLTISYTTVKKHSSHIYQKLGVGGRRQAVDRARTLGLLPS